MNLPKKCVVDTNVPKIANLSTKPDSDSDAPDECILSCIKAIDHVIKNQALVIDNGDEIFTEYRRQLSMKGQPGMGDKFMKWVNDHRWTLPDSNRVTLTKTNDSYDQFPSDSRLADFDPSDRKFVAVVNGHSGKPPILQATDSKWWGFRTILSELGITVYFLCPEYVQKKFEEKIETKDE